MTNNVQRNDNVQTNVLTSNDDWFSFLEDDIDSWQRCWKVQHHGDPPQCVPGEQGLQQEGGIRISYHTTTTTTTPPPPPLQSPRPGWRRPDDLHRDDAPLLLRRHRLPHDHLHEEGAGGLHQLLDSTKICSARGRTRICTRTTWTPQGEVQTGVPLGNGLKMAYNENWTELVMMYIVALSCHWQSKWNCHVTVIMMRKAGPL